MSKGTILYNKYILTILSLCLNVLLAMVVPTSNIFFLNKSIESECEECPGLKQCDSVHSFIQTHTS